MIKVVLIDIDNTLLSFSGYVKQTMKEGFAEFGLAEYNESMYTTFKTINDGLWLQIEQGTLTFEKLMEIRWNRIFKALNIEFDGRVFEKYFREKLFDSAVLEPGALELLGYLSERYILGVASNGPYEQQINRLRVGKMYDYFKYFFVSEKIGAQKPTKEFFDACFREMREDEFAGLLSEEVMMIGDSVTADISGGKEYGMKTCLYRNGKAAPESVPQADYIVNDLSEIMQIL